MIFNAITHEAAQQKPSTSAQAKNAQTIHEAALQKPSTSEQAKNAQTTYDVAMKNPSTNAQLTIAEKQAELDFKLDWSDFSEELTFDKVNSIPGKHLKY